ncbi:MAG: insulinase family protein [Clostridia bacterium]|nr:insulinase family protein [Clostridia bacterium]
MNTRKWLAMLMILALALGMWPGAMAEPTDAEALPGVGDVVHGFEVVELRDYPLVDATIVRFTHKQTGAEVYYIANDDTNRAFDLTFFTEPIDNTGLPHVFEHATIQGSEKYPGEQMFFNLSYQTYNTYMNAFTGKWYTSFPLASLSEAQLLKLAEFYTDACFNPVIMENERIYRTEAWRYRLESADAPLTIEGTVYSEMLGATTLQRQAGLNLMQAAFPGSMVGNDAGGTPDAITDMTWQMLKDYHDRYYHPSNCAAYLYGQLENYRAFLQLLDGYFSAYEKREFARNDVGYTPITEPVVQSLPFPMEKGANTEHASVVQYAFVCPGLKQTLGDELALDTMTDLFTAGASDLQQRLREAIPYGSFSAYINMDGPEDAIIFIATNVDPGDAETIKTIVDEEIAKVASDGFPQALVDSVAASLAISARLTRESSAPVDGIISQMLGRYATTGNCWDLQDYQDSLFRMDEWNREGLYAGVAGRWLKDSRTTALVTTYPEPGAKEKNDAALAEKLEQTKAAMSAEEIAALVEATNAEAPEDHSAEYVARLKAVTVESLPEEIKEYAVNDATGDDGIRRIDVPAAVEGISRANILLDAAGLPQEDLHWFTLYLGLITQMDTTAHTKAELATLFSRYLYNGSIDLSLPRVGADGYHPYLSLSWIALDDDLAAGYDLMHELLYDTKVDDPAKLLEQVQSVKANYKSNVTANPAGTLMGRALAGAGERYAYKCYATGLDYYTFLGEVEKLLADAPGTVTAKLKGIQEYFNNSANAVTVCAGNEGSIALNRELADKFLASLDKREITPAQYAFPAPKGREALIIDSGVQFNMVAAHLGVVGLEGFDGRLDAVTKLVSDAFLVPQLRDQYGVYTPWSAADEDYFMIYAYRDPNVAETFQVLEQLPPQIEAMDLDQDTLDGYIMNAYSAYAMPEGELTGAINAAMDALQGLDPARKLEWMRQLKQLTPGTVHADAGLFTKLMENGARLTAGAASAINENAALFDAILNPFGAVDNTQVELSDVTEGSEHYEAVRFAFEEGFMAPVSDTEFGVDAPATEGDLLAALYVLVGGERDANEALAAFVEYGLVTTDTDLNAPILPEDIWGLLSAVVGETVDPMTETASPDAVTRAELAEAIMAFVDGLE